MSACMRCFVTGRVQGVFFRASAQSFANKLGLKGYARNLSDGRVEVLACGDEPELNQLKEWLWAGPQYAQVTDLSCDRVNLKQVPPSFTIE